jgi:hypothetical protein
VGSVLRSFFEKALLIKEPFYPESCPKWRGMRKNKGMNWGFFALLEEKS